MLPQINRLKKEKDIKKVLKEGEALNEEVLVLKVIKNNLKNSRFGFIISGKISKKATIRNKIKRRLSETIRTKIKKIKTGADGLFIVKPGIEKKEIQDVDKIINKILFRANLLND